MRSQHNSSKSSQHNFDKNQREKKEVKNTLKYHSLSINNVLVGRKKKLNANFGDKSVKL